MPDIRVWRGKGPAPVTMRKIARKEHRSRRKERLDALACRLDKLLQEADAVE
jgi:hypothetical protein